ncbi:hypothetical protein [Acetobacter persici]|uniref:Uncharacterized protein n=1 Tax=Acetobacter persici TaxID=1076596 RepID=A0A1U9LG33_9PROT|nr:hypothetical protein [Acetobacter persici]AQT05339.1 hypothetical protein A0U91_11245 [Acetobacter persici]
MTSLLKTRFLLSLCSGVALVAGAGGAAFARPNHLLPQYQVLGQATQSAQSTDTAATASATAITPTSTTPSSGSGATASAQTGASASSASASPLLARTARLRSVLTASPLASNAPVYGPTRPPGGLDAATGVPALWQNATIGQIGAMADGSVQQSDKNSPNGVAGLDATGTMTAPVSGDLSSATARISAAGAAGRTLCRPVEREGFRSGAGR